MSRRPRVLPGAVTRLAHLTPIMVTPIHRAVDNLGGPAGMSIRERAVTRSNAAVRRRGGQAKIARLLEHLDGEERAEVIALVWDDTDISSTAVGAELTEAYGHIVGRITDQQIRNHRNYQPRPE
jgi:hypothetical protein